MSKAVFRSMLETSVTVKESLQYQSFDGVPLEARWVEVSGSPIMARVSSGAVGRGRVSEPSSRAGDSAVFGVYPEADFVLYYDGADVTLDRKRSYLFEWIDTGGVLVVGISKGPGMAMGGGATGFMRIAVDEQMRVVGE